MNREEFENLTGITVSHNYYTINIEPEYTAGNVEKQEFCAQWVKDHKKDICKALSSDISGMTWDDAVIRMIKAECKRYKETVTEQQEEMIKIDAERHNLKSELERKTEILKSMTIGRDSSQEKADSLKDANRRLLEEKEGYEKSIAEKDTEIMKLKAMLFDAMYKTA